MSCLTQRRWLLWWWWGVLFTVYTKDGIRIEYWSRLFSIFGNLMVITGKPTQILLSVVIISWLEHGVACKISTIPRHLNFMILLVFEGNTRGWWLPCYIHGREWDQADTGWSTQDAAQDGCSKLPRQTQSNNTDLTTTPSRSHYVIWAIYGYCQYFSSKMRYAQYFSFLALAV